MANAGSSATDPLTSESFLGMTLLRLLRLRLTLNVLEKLREDERFFRLASSRDLRSLSSSRTTFLAIAVWYSSSISSGSRTC